MNKLKIGLMAASMMALTACGSQTQDQAASIPASEPPTSTADSGHLDATATPEAVVDVSSCNIETIDGERIGKETPRLQSGASVRITGWLIDEQAQSVPAQVVLKLKGENGSVVRERAVLMWRDRPDVVAAKGGVNEYLKSGFAVDVSFEDVGSGRYGIVLSGRNVAGPFLCDSGRVIVVGQ